MLLRAFAILLLFTGPAAAQTASAERSSRAAGRDLRADRGREVARAATPAERASRDLNQGTRADRFRDAAQDARGDYRPIRPEVQQFEPQRRSLQPDVGRPEQSGRITGTDGTVGGLPSMGSNPQR